MGRYGALSSIEFPWLAENMKISPMGSIQRRLLLGCILVVYVFNVERWAPSAFFGIYQDDSIYFSTAKALAQGHGYVLISFPGTPPQTKYPILYPWLLSWVWKLNPAFPGNLKLAIHLTEFFGCWTLLAVFLFLRRLEGLSEWAALFLTTLLAFQPFFIRLSGLVMSDVPFMALLWTALLLTNAAKDSKRSPLLMLAAGGVAGLSVGTRMVGIAVFAGILCATLLARAFRNAFVFAASFCVAGLIVCAPTMFHHAPDLTSASEPGWNQVVLNYTNYARFQWGMSIPSVGAFLKLIKLNFLILLTYPGTVVAGPSAAWADRLMAVLSVPIWLGIVRQSRQPAWRAAACTVFIYGVILLVWPYAIPDRFLVPLIPLFLAGAWCELGRLGRIMITNLGAAAPLSQRVVAGALSAVLILIFGFIAWNYVIEDPKRLSEASVYRASALQERGEAYQWIRQHTAPEDRVAAWDDFSLYLYTGRQALRPIAILPQAAYMSDKRSLQRDLDHICDAPRHVGARYWLIGDDDLALESDPQTVGARITEVKSALPMLFRSSSNHFQIYDASCVAESGRAECSGVVRVLFPYRNQ